MIDFYEYMQNIKKTNELIDELTVQSVEKYDTGLIKQCTAAAKEAVVQSEKQLILLREVLYSFYSPTAKEAKEYNEAAAVGFNISITKMNFEFDAYLITLPMLLPNQRSRWQGFKETIGSALHYTLNDYCASHNIRPLDNCIVIFTTYLQKNNTLFTSDNDNKETKSILNILSKNIIRDDNGFLCDLMYRTIPTNTTNKTEIIIVEKQNFQKLYSAI